MIRELKAGSIAKGFLIEHWTLPWVGQFIKRRFGRRHSDAQVCRILKSLNFSCQRPSGRARQRDWKAIRKWKQKRWPAPKKTPIRTGQTIVFVDESGLSERPTRGHIRAPKGQTPVLHYSFNWKQLPVIAGVTYWQFYYRFFPGAIRAA